MVLLFHTVLNAAGVVLLLGMTTIVAVLINRKFKRVENNEVRQDSKINFKRLIENGQDIIFATLPDGRLTFVSPAWLHLLGNTEEYILGHPLTDFIHPEDVEKATDKFQKLKQKQLSAISEEVRMKDANESWRWFLLNVVCRNALDGTSVGCEGTIREITQRKTLEFQLQQTKHNYRTFFNTVNDFLYVLDEKGVLIEINAAAINKTGFSKEDLLGKSVLDMHQPERRDEALYNARQILSGKAELSLVPVIAKDGTLIPVESKVTKGFWDGKPAIFGVAKDISRLKLSEEKFSKLFNLSPSASILTHVGDQRILEVNGAFCRLLGFDKEEAVGKTPAELGIVTQQTVDDVRATARKGRVVNFAAVLKAKNGELKDVALSIEDIQVQDNTYRLFVTFNMTMQKQAENQLKESKKRLLEAQRMAHVGSWELDPISGIVMATEEAFAIYGLDFDANAPYGTIQDLRDRVNPEEFADYNKKLDDLIAGKINYYDDEYSIINKKTGGIRYIHSIGILNKDEDGKTSKIIGTLQDITERKLMVNALRNSEVKYEEIVSEIADVICIIKQDGVIEYKSPNISRYFGWLPEELVGTSFLNGIHPDDRDRIKNDFNRIVNDENSTETIECRYLCKNGMYKPIMLTASNLTNNSAIQGVLANYRDISEIKRRQDEILYLSYHDQLTGLFNRRYYEQALKKLNAENNLPFSIVMGDVDGLKLINDSFGHEMGDALLKKVSDAVISICRKDDIAARLGGDEFVIILPKTDAEATEQVIRRINEAVAAEKLGALDVSISFGWDTKYEPGKTVQEMFKNAEDQMYKQKLFESPSMRGRTINAIITTLHEKNKREEQHSHRVSVLCESTGRALKLPQKTVDVLKSVGLLHDIGKIAIDENILNKPGSLSPEEYAEIKRHPEKGYRILSTVNDMSEMAEYVLAHHERWDGNGYPKGLKGKEIPYISRIIAIADAYDAMTSERSYRAPMPEEQVRRELLEGAGIQFDPELIQVFVAMVFGGRQH